MDSLINSELKATISNNTENITFFQVLIIKKEVMV